MVSRKPRFKSYLKEIPMDLLVFVLFLAIGFQRIKGDTSSSLRFPASMEDVADVLDFDFIPAQVELPPTLFRARMRNRGRAQRPTDLL